MSREPEPMSTELTLTSGSPPRASTKEQVLQPTSKPLSSYTLKKYIWRPYVTPFERIVDRHYSGSGTEEDAYIVDWLPDDPEDPQRWGGVYKWSQIFLVSFATLAVALSSSAYSGGIKSLEREYGARPELLTAGISLFVVGFAFGPLLWAPLSEVYGRRPIYIISFAMLTIWTGATTASQNVAQILVFRFLSGLFGSSPLANAGGTISDVLSANQRGLGLALFAAAPFLGPALGPIIGGFLGVSSGWRWVEGFLTIFCGAILVLLALFGAETYAPCVLRRRADRLSAMTGKVYRFRSDAKKPLNIGNLFRASLSRPWKFLIIEPIVAILTIYTAVIYGVLYLNFSAYPIIFQKLRGWNSGVGGLAFLGILVGVLISVLIAVVYINPKYIKLAKKRGGRATPEDRLPPAIWGGVLIVVGLAGFAATDGPDIHWSAPIIFGIPFGLGTITVFLSVFNYLIDSYTIYAASVMAANSVLRSLFGAAFPLFTTYMYENLGIHWAAALPGFIALACIPFTVMFYKYGASIRARCRYAADAEQQMNAIMVARAEQTKTDEEDNMTTEGEGGSDDTHGGDEEKEKSSEDKLHPSDPESPRHHQWTMYEELADRDGIDLNDEERMRLKTLHGKFNYEKAEPDEGRMSPREGMRDVATWTGADIREVTRSVTGLVKGNSVTSQGVGTGESLNTRWHSPDSFFALNQTTKRSATRFERFDFEPNRSVTHLDYQPDRSVTRLDQPNPSATRLEYQPDQDVDHERFVTRTRPDYSPDRSVRQERFVEQERPVGQEGFIGTQQPARQQASTVQEQSVPLNHHWRNSYFALDPPVAATHPSPTSYQNNSVQEQIFRTHHNYPSTSALGQPVAPGQESSTTLNDLPTGRRLA